MTTSKIKPKSRILIFHIGSLGDTLVATPAFWAIYDAFPDAYRVLLTKRVASEDHVIVGPQLFEGTSMFHNTLFYPGERYLDKRLRRFLDFLLLAFQIRMGRFDTLVYLVPSSRSREQMERDRRFFRFCGIRTLIGFTAETFLPDLSCHPLSMQVSEAEMLLKRLRLSGLHSPEISKARLDLDLNETDERLVHDWLSRQNTSDGERSWVAFAAGSNMPAKKWPEERYIEVGKDLIAQRDIWPVFFGGKEDVALGERLIKAWGRGYNGAGVLPPRAAASALRRCHLFIGNDTGTMHLAASVGVRCIAVFSARDFPGKWYPVGNHHTVIRKQVACEGCMLEDCTEHNNECLTMISADEVMAAAFRPQT